MRTDATRAASAARARWAARLAGTVLVLSLACGTVCLAQPLSIPDVPFISQSEALCGGAAAAMVLRYWGATGLTAESFAPLVDRSAAGIAVGTLVTDIRARGFMAEAIRADASLARAQLTQGRPLIALIEDRPGTLHYVVIVAWQERGVIVHDPARAPFQVWAPAEFERRWSRADRTALLVTPGQRDTSPSAAASPSPDTAAGGIAPSADGTATPCEQLVSTGVGAAQRGDLALADRTLTQALGCPRGDAARELAGVRLLQRRWSEVEVLAGAATTADPGDGYAWKLLGTARFIDGRAAAALDAWNRAGEPRVDLVQVTGLRHTRQRVVERLVAVRPAGLLTSTTLARGARALAELPSAQLTALSYTPVANGRAQLRASIVEGDRYPHGTIPLMVMAAGAAINREVEARFASPTGGGVRVSVGWRFWPERPRYSLELAAPAPWGGVWQASASHERQPFTDALLPTARRSTGRLTWATWPAARVRVQVASGLDRWDAGAHPFVGGGVRLLSLDSRVVAADLTLTQWMRRDPFALARLQISGATSSAQRGTVLVGSIGISAVSRRAPLDLWVGGDTGHVQPTLLRAHPVLDEGRLRVERLGRLLTNATVEGQRWSRVGPVGVAVAGFADVARTSSRRHGGAVNDVDVGVGLRIAPRVLPGTLRIDVGKGLRDGATALTFAFAR